MHRLLRHFSPKNNVPELGRNPKAKFITSKVMLVVVALETVEIGALMLGGVDVVEGVVGEIVAEIAYQEAQPEGKVQLLVVEVDHAIDCKIAGKDGQEAKGWRVHNPIALLKRYLRVDWKHVVDAMQNVMQVADNPVVGKQAFTVEDKAVDQILGEGETE